MKKHERSVDGEYTMGTPMVRLLRYDFNGKFINGKFYSLDSETALIYPRYVKYCKEGYEEETLSKEELAYLKKQQLDNLSCY